MGDIYIYIINILFNNIYTNWIAVLDRSICLPGVTFQYSSDTVKIEPQKRKPKNLETCLLFEIIILIVSKNNNNNIYLKSNIHKMFSRLVRIG